MEQHLDQSVLTKLPSSYKSHLKQSSSSEADDMGKMFYSQLTLYTLKALICLSSYLVTRNCLAHFICTRLFESILGFYAFEEAP